MAARRGMAVRELIRGLKAAGVDLPHAVRPANVAMANILIKEARRRAAELGGVAEHVAPSLHTAARDVTVSVILGGRGYPMAGGAEFGAHRNMLRERAGGGSRRALRPRRHQTVHSVDNRLRNQRAHGLKVGVVGWNQFRKYRREGWWLFPSLPATSEERLQTFLDQVLVTVGPHLHLVDGTG